MCSVLAQVDESLEAFLRAVTPLSAVDIDVSFHAPDEEWAAKLTRPTVNLYLWDIRRSTNRAVTGVETADRDGVTLRRMALPRVDLHYFVSVWTTEHDDERALISALTIALLGHAELPAIYVAPSLALLPNPQLMLARTGDADVYSLDSRMKLGLQLQVVTVVDTGAGTPLAREVSELSVSVRDLQTGATDAPLRRIAGECRDPAAVGATVRSPGGIAFVNESGRFLIAARPGDELVLELDPPQTVVVPPVGGVVIPGAASTTAPASAPRPADVS